MKNTITKEVSNKIANMGFACACLVVLIHVPCSDGCIDQFVKYWIKGGVSQIAVPTFFIISGFFLGQHIDEDGWYGRAIRKRIRTLVIPFFVLNLMWWPIEYGFHYVGVKYFGMNGSNPNSDITLMNFLYYTGILPWGGQCVGPLWYVRALVYLVLASPVLVWIVNRGKSIILCALVALLLLWCLQVESFPYIGEFLKDKMSYEYSFRCPLYFVIGLLLSQRSAKRYPMYMQIIMACVAIGLFFVSRTCKFSSASISIVMGFVSTLFIAELMYYLMPSKGWPKVLVGNAFPVYVLHNMIIYLFPVVFKALKIWDKTLNTIGGVSFFFITVAISISTAELIKRCFPRFANVIFGGR